MFDALLDFFFPRSQISQEEWNTVHIHVYKEQAESLRRREIYFLDSIASACNYHDTVLLQKALNTLKYKRIPSASHRLAELLTCAGASYAEEGMTLVPVPLHWRRRFDRGYNQAALLGRKTAAALELPFANLLTRTRDTGHQAWRSREDRLTAMHGAFSPKRCVCIPHHVVLVDDIATTGATLDACAKVLKSAGAVRVDAWVVARG